MYQVCRLGGECTKCIDWGGGGGECTKCVDYRVSVPSVLARG